MAKTDESNESGDSGESSESGKAAETAETTETAGSAAPEEKKKKKGAEPDLAGVAGEASQTRERMDQLKRAKRATTLVGVVGVVAFLAIIVGWSLAIYGKAKDLVSEESKKAFMAELEHRGDSILSTLSETMLKVANEVMPAFSEAFSSQMGEGAAVIGHEIDGQVESLKANVEKKLQERLDEALQSIAERGVEKLKRTFAQLADKPDVLDRMMSSIHEGFRNWVTRELSTTLHAHMDALLDIRTTLLQFEPQAGGRKVSTEDVLGLWLEIVYEQLGGDEALEPTYEPPEAGGE